VLSWPAAAYADTVCCSYTFTHTQCKHLIVYVTFSYTKRWCPSSSTPLAKCWVIKQLFNASLREWWRDSGKMTQRKLITHFINRLWCQWNIAVSTAASLDHLALNQLESQPTPRTFLRTRTVAYTCTGALITLTHTCMPYSFFCPYLCLLLCRCFISQPGEYLNVIMTFAIKSKQRGRIEDCLLDFQFSTLRVLQRVECCFDCFSLFSAFFSTNWHAFLRDRFIVKAPAARLIWPTLLWQIPSLSKVRLFYLGVRVNEDDFIASNRFYSIYVIHW